MFFTVLFFCLLASRILFYVYCLTLMSVLLRSESVRWLEAGIILQLFALNFELNWIIETM